MYVMSQVSLQVEADTNHVEYTMLDPAVFGSTSTLNEMQASPVVLLTRIVVVIVGVLKFYCCCYCWSIKCCWYYHKRGFRDGICRLFERLSQYGG